MNRQDIFKIGIVNWLIIKVLERKISKSSTAMVMSDNDIVKRAYNHKIETFKSSIVFLKSEKRL